MNSYRWADRRAASLAIIWTAITLRWNIPILRDLRRLLGSTSKELYNENLQPSRSFERNNLHRTIQLCSPAISRPFSGSSYVGVHSMPCSCFYSKHQPYVNWSLSLINFQLKSKNSVQYIIHLCYHCILSSVRFVFIARNSIIAFVGFIFMREILGQIKVAGNLA